MSKSISGLFHGILSTTYANSSSKETSYTDRGIEVPKHIQDALTQLKKTGDFIKSDGDSFSMTDASILSKETGVEFAKVSIGSDTYLIRGNAKGTVIPDSLMKRIKANQGTLEFHSHPHNDDLVPSYADRELMKRLRSMTGQTYSTIVTPNGRTATFNEHGVIEIGTVHYTIDENLKKLYYEMFGG